MLASIHVGSDISFRWFDVCFSLKEKAPVTRYPNTPEGHSQFIEEVGKLARKVYICMEHTGGYETALALACLKAKFIVSIIDGGMFSNYRKSLGYAKSKTDSEDARLLAKFCKERKPAKWFPLPDEYLELKELVNHREDLIEQKKRLSCQASHRVKNTFVSASRHTVIEVLELQIEGVEKEIAAFVKACPTLKKQVQLLVSIPGVAFVSAVRILAETGPISNYATAKDYALAAGLVPIVFNSGVKTPPGKLAVYGNKRLRCAFYFPAVVNSHRKTTVGAFMERVNGHGNKLKMTVIVAGMRKIAHIVFGVLKSQSKYNPELT